MKKISQYFNKIKEGRISLLAEELKWIYSYSKSQWLLIVIYSLIGFLNTSVLLKSSVVSKDLVDIITGHNTGEVLKTFISIILLQLLGVLIGQTTGFISSFITSKICNNLRADIYDKIMVTEWESLSQFHSGDISMRWSGDTSVVSNSVLTLLPNFLQILYKFITAFILVVQNDASFVVFALISAPVSILTTKYSYKKIKKYSMSMMETSTSSATFTSEAFSNFQYVKAFDLRKSFSKKIRELQKKQLKNTMNYQVGTNLSSIFTSLISSVVTYSTYGWGIYKVWHGDVSYGTMTMFLSLSASLSGSLQSLFSFIPNTIAASNSARRLIQICELPKEDNSQEDDISAFKAKYSDKGIGIALCDASFSYKNGTDVFRNIDFIAQPNEIVALVGPSGEGKTTMLRMLLALVRNTGNGFVFSGNSSFSSNNANFDEQFPLSAATRQLFAYVPQGNTMFTGTIADNMRLVKEDATDDEIIHALELACAWDFVKDLPDGINSVIRERGQGFSEGQAQRLSIARALIRKSPILLLDEATSALDIVTEKQLLQNILNDDYPRTTIVTAHRLSIIKACSKVYRIKESSCTLLNEDEIRELINL